LKPHLRITVETLLRKGRSQREIERLTGVDRKTIRRYEREGKALSGSNSSGVATGSEGQKSGVSEEETPPPRPPARAPREARSACEEHRAWIQDQVQLGRNAQSIYQDLVEGSGSPTATTRSSASRAGADWRSFRRIPPNRWC
jgi:transcriptional regulator with XRE-family HTH domain